MIFIYFDDLKQNVIGEDEKYSQRRELELQQIKWFHIYIRNSESNFFCFGQFVGVLFIIITYNSC